MQHAHSTALSLLLIAVAVAKFPAARYLGGVVEWLMAPVLKFEFKILP